MILAVTIDTTLKTLADDLNAVTLSHKQISGWIPEQLVDFKIIVQNVHGIILVATFLCTKGGNTDVAV